MTREQINTICDEQKAVTLADGRKTKQTGFNITISTEFVEGATEEDFTQHLTTALTNSISAWMQQNPGWLPLTKPLFIYKAHPKMRDPENCRKSVDDESQIIFTYHILMVEATEQ